MPESPVPAPAMTDADFLGHVAERLDSLPTGLRPTPEALLQALAKAGHPLGAPEGCGGTARVTRTAPRPADSRSPAANLRGERVRGAPSHIGASRCG
ncbi:hypothetical protein [Streptomyces sp. NPDC007063]|uniref:hypothetical protein n=1 Tax=Streptomyces sp. NPDC007063 TaxID=3364772 RepID=UPI00368EA84D